MLKSATQTAKQVILRRGNNENVCEMSKNEKYTYKACKTVVHFHCEICTFVTFLLPSSSWLLKLPTHSLSHRVIEFATDVPPEIQEPADSFCRAP